MRHFSNLSLLTTATKSMDRGFGIVTFNSRRALSLLSGAHGQSKMFCAPKVLLK